MKAKTLAIIFLLIFHATTVSAKLHKITAYCTCKICCGKWSDGYVASGKEAKVGMVACNYLSFGTRVSIDGLGDFVVEDRGAKRYFGTKDKPLYAIDIFMPSHEKAKQFGVKHLNVEREVS